MKPRLILLALSALAWAGFVLVILWAVCFLVGVVVSPTVDGPVRLGTLAAVVTDLGLLALFAVQHSVMARASAKAVMRRRIPRKLERTVYVASTVVCLAVCFRLWQPFGGTVWRFDGPLAVVAWALYALGWTLAFVSTFAVDHLELIGLRQAGWAVPRGPEPSGTLQTHGLYGVVRHPLMTGLLTAFWATPRMSAAHLLFAAMCTAYVFVGVRFEERDLRRTFGTAYEAYAARVPALVPRRLTPWRPRAQRGSDPGAADEPRSHLRA